MNKVICDVDEVLCPFSKAFYNEVKNRGYDFPVPEEWDHWNVFWLYFSKEQAFPIFDTIHSKQTIYAPYEDAKYLLDYLHKHFKIIIASHRNPEYEGELKLWLDKYHLPYDEIHTSFDKSVLFTDKDVKIIIDDRPETLVLAMKAGKIAIGPMKPWNKKCGQLMLFQNLRAIKKYIEKEVIHE
jgi:hypothetical protein